MRQLLPVRRRGRQDRSLCAHSRRVLRPSAPLLISIPPPAYQPQSRSEGQVHRPIRDDGLILDFNSRRHFRSLQSQILRCLSLALRMIKNSNQAKDRRLALFLVQSLRQQRQPAGLVVAIYLRLDVVCPNPTLFVLRASIPQSRLYRRHHQRSTLRGFFIQLGL